jgi:hypothetical protein
MSGVVVYAVAGAQGHAQAETGGLTMTWTGWDDSEWNLLDGSAGVRLLAGEVVGLGFSPADRFTTVSPAVAGSRFRGTRTLERPVRWPLLVEAADPITWFERDTAFARTLHRERVGTWTVTQVPTGISRTLTCRFVASPDGHSADPGPRGLATYEVELVAEDPYWHGAVVARTFRGATEEPFVPEGGGPPFTISSASNLSSAVIENPGDVPVWPVWTITGPTTAVTLGVDGHEIGVAGDLDEGDVLVIDTHPARQSATLNGVRVRGVLAPHDFAPVPAGGVSSLDITVTGLGTVNCAIEPLFERAW